MLVPSIVAFLCWADWHTHFRVIWRVIPLSNFNLLTNLALPLLVITPVICCLVMSQPMTTAGQRPCTLVHRLYGVAENRVVCVGKEGHPMAEKGVPCLES